MQVWKVNLLFIIQDTLEDKSVSEQKKWSLLYSFQQFYI